MQSAPQTRPWREQYEGMIPTLVNKTMRYCADENLALVNIPFGAVVSRVTSSKFQVTQPTATAARIAGICVGNMQRSPITIGGVMHVRATDPVTVLENGDIVMYSEAAGKRGDQVYFRYAVDAGRTRLSAIANAAGTGLDPLRGGIYLQDCTAGSLVWIKYDLTLPAIV